MNIHPSIIQLSRLLHRYLPIPAAVAATTYLITLSGSVCPGKSAVLTAAAANLTAASGADHPIFAWAARGVASLPFFTLPIRMNLFSALCGALCAMLLFSLISRLVLYFACETSGGAGRIGGTDLTPISKMPPEVADFNRQTLRVAVMAGIVASFLLTFSVAHWSASTRLDTGTFHLLIALASLHLFLNCWTTLRIPLRIPNLTLSFFIFTLGLFDFAAFVLLLPFYLYFLFLYFFQSSRRKTVVSGLFLAGFSAASFAFVAYCRNRTFPDALPLPTTLRMFATDLTLHHYHQLRSFFPSSGWILMVAQTALPGMVVLFGMRTLFKGRTPATFLALLLLILSCAPGFLILPHSLWFFAQSSDGLPVFSFALIVSAAAIAVAACLKILLVPSELEPARVSSRTRGVLKQQRVATAVTSCAIALLSLLALIAVITPFRSYSYVDARKYAFADELARDVLGLMKDRTWLISNGLLDKHLLIQAHILKQPLTIVPFSPRVHSQELCQLDAKIVTDPLFDKQNRVRLQNALSIGTIRFVMEWFANDPSAGDHVIVLAPPDIWTACNYRVVPEGLAFGGIRAEQSVDPLKIEKMNRVFAEKYLPVFSNQNIQSPHLNALRRLLRTALGFTSNELGVFLEEMNQPETALRAYLRAATIDPSNISADINAYTLMRNQNLKPELLDRMRNKIKGFEKDPVVKRMTLPDILKTFGAIRQPKFYQMQSEAWSAIGSTTAASDKVSKGASLAGTGVTNSTVETGLKFLRVGDLAQAESCFKSVLEKDPSNAAALSSMAAVMLARRDIDGTDKWLERAVKAGAPESDALHIRISLASLKGNNENALSQILAATKKYPSDLRYWMMLADVLLKQKESQKVEFEVLPAMQEALKTKDHYLIHTVRGFLLKSKGIASYQAARLAFLRALSLNVSLPDVWVALFEVDLAMGNPEFLEADAKNQLTVDPDHALANFLMGSICLDRKALERSEDFLRRSIGKTPTAPACNNLGENLRQQKRLKEAEPFARQALTIQPDFSPALDTLACILLDDQRFDEATQCSKRANSISPNTPAYRLTLLRACVKQKDFEGVSRLSNELKASKTSIPETLQKEIRDIQSPMATAKPKG